MVPAAKQKDALLEFFTVYPTYSGKYKKKPAGTVQSIGKGKDDPITLESLKMRIGDCIDVNIRTGTKPMLSTNS